MVEVTGDQDVARFVPKTVADPVRRIVRLEILRRRKVRKWVARAPESVGRLPRAKLAAVPHDAGLRAPRRRFGGGALHGLPPFLRQRALGIDVRPDGVTVMHKEEAHGRILVGGSWLGLAKVT